MREKLVSVTAKDCRWDYFKGSGAGGQKRNKTSSAVRCTHIGSGAVGQSSDTRSQLKNKQLAFKRMADSKKFRIWLKIASAKATGKLADIRTTVEISMRDENIKIEGRVDNSWIELKD